MKKLSAITASSVRLRPNQQHGCLGMRSLIQTAILGILFSSFICCHWLLYCRANMSVIRPLLPRPSPSPPPGPKLSIGGFQFPDSTEVSNETIFMYSQLNPAVRGERDRIKFLVEATHFGNISFMEALPKSMVPKLTAIGPVRPTRKPLIGQKAKAMANSWTFPFRDRRAIHSLQKFTELSKTWLGDDGELNPRIIMQDLIETVKKPLNQNLAYWSNQTLPDENMLEGKDRYQSCAVVGNSGILLNGSYGNEIDSHEMVIRLNYAILVNYTAQVGSKTTLAFTNGNVFQSCSMRLAEDCRCHKYGQEVPTVLYVCQAVNLLHVAKCMSKQGNSTLLVTHSHFDALCGAVVKWYSVTNFLQTTRRTLPEWDSVHDELEFHYSSGMQAVVLALGMCESVDLYGFGKFANVTHHYHTKRKEELSLHDYAAEYLFYDDLVHNRTIPFLGDAGISLPPVRTFY